jgi:hypothetical protein
MGESQCDYDGYKRALSGTNNVAHVDGNLTVRGTGRDDRTIEASRRMRISGHKS